jgi:hypothetical protein
MVFLHDIPYSISRKKLHKQYQPYKSVASTYVCNEAALDILKRTVQISASGLNTTENILR